MTIDLQAAHGRLGVKGLHTLLRSIDGEAVHLLTEDGQNSSGCLAVAEEVIRLEWVGVPDRDRVGGGFTTCGVWENNAGVLDTLQVVAIRPNDGSVYLD